MPSDSGQAVCTTTYAPAFEAFTGNVIATCAAAGGGTDDLTLIAQAKGILVRAGLYQPGDFNGVDIRWCALSNATGMTPASNRIFLHPSLQGSPFDLATVLAHEMVHIKQFRRWGTLGFACRYGEQVAAGRGEGRANSVEAEAYQFQDRAAARIAHALRQLPGRGPTR